MHPHGTGLRPQLRLRILGPDIYYDTDKGAVCANKANFKDAFAKKGKR